MFRKGLILIIVIFATACSEMAPMAAVDSMAIPQGVSLPGVPGLSVPVLAPPMVAAPQVNMIVPEDRSIEDPVQLPLELDFAGSPDPSGDPNDPCKGKKGLPEETTSYLFRTEDGGYLRYYFSKVGGVWKKSAMIDFGVDKFGTVRHFIDVPDEFGGQGVATDVYLRAEHDIRQLYGPNTERALVDINGYNYSCLKSKRPFEKKINGDGEMYDAYRVGSTRDVRPIPQPLPENAFPKGKVPYVVEQYWTGAFKI